MKRAGKTKRKGEQAPSSAPTMHEEGLAPAPGGYCVGATCLQGLTFFPSLFQTRGVNPTFTFRSGRSLEKENSEAVQMQTLATADLVINSSEEHHELQRERSFLPPPSSLLPQWTQRTLEFALLHTRRPVAENEVKSTKAGPNSAKWHQLRFCCCEGVILQCKFLVLTQSFRLFFMVLPHGSSPWAGLPRGKILNQAK